MKWLPSLHGHPEILRSSIADARPAAAEPSAHLLVEETPREWHEIARSFRVVRRAEWMRRVVMVVLLLLPAVLYWQTIFHRYGFRDDYAILRESHEERGKVTRVCAMQGRPVYGVLMELSFARLQSIDDLQWLRLLSAVLLGTAAAVTYQLLCGLKWESATAGLLAALLTTLPGAQLLVSWTVAWPLNVALLLALASFACAEKAFGSQASQPRWGYWVAAISLIAASALTYQPNALFYFVLVAAGLWPRRRWTTRPLVSWFVRHFVVAGLGLAAAFTITMTAFAHGWVSTSNRVALEHDWIGKLGWFVLEPLQNAFALIVLNDNQGSSLVYRAAAMVVVFILGGVACEWQTRGWRHGLRWLAMFGALLLASFSVNLLVADRWAVYRVLLPLTGVVAVFCSTSLLILGGRAAARAGLALLVMIGALLARRQAFDLVAWPQGLELSLMEQGAAKINLASNPSIFVITPTGFDRTTEQSFRDEFGSLSTDSDWVPREMLALILQSQHPDFRDVTAHYAFSCGRKLPAGGLFDVVIDLRRLRTFRETAADRYFISGSMPSL